MKRMGRPPPGAKQVQRWTGRRWTPDDGKVGLAFIGQEDGYNMAWTVDLNAQVHQRAMAHCLATFKDCANGAHMVEGDGRRAAVVVLINEAGHVLSIARKDDPTRFGLPGGKCTYYEAPKDAAIRGLREETGIAARVDQVQHLYRDVNADGWNVDAYLVYDWSGEARTEVRWTPWEGLYGPPWGQYNRNVEQALRGERRQILKEVEDCINEAKGCRLVDVALQVGQKVHPHGELATLVDELIDRGRIQSIAYQVPGPRKHRVTHKLLLPKGSVVL